jgi:hypothetical protein
MGSGCWAEGSCSPGGAVESSHQKDLESMATVGKQMRAARLAVVQSHAASR